MNKRPRAALMFPAALAIAAVLVPGPVQAGSPPIAVTEQTTTTTTTSTTSTTVAPEPTTTTVAEPAPPISATVAPTTPARGSVDDGLTGLNDDQAAAAAATSVAPSTAPEVMAAAAEATGSIGGRVFQDFNNDGVLDSGDGGYNAEVDIVCGEVKVTERSNVLGEYLVENLPLGDCTVSVNPAKSFFRFESLVTQTFDPDGALDGTSNVTLTPDAPTQPNLNFGYRTQPAVFMNMWVAKVEDTVADQRTSVGDTIRYGFSVQAVGTGTTGLDLTVTDTKLGLVDVKPDSVVADPLYAEYYFEAPYVITAADVAAGGVEASATVRAVDPKTGVVLTARSDTSTGVNGETIPLPWKVETDNPLKVNPNDPNNPMDDPTTYLIPKTTSPSVNPPTTLPSTRPVTGSSSGVLGAVALMLVAIGVSLRLATSRSARRAA